MSGPATSRPSAHARRRDALAVAADTDALVARLAEAGHADASARWRRHHGRFHGGTDTWATVVLESPVAPMLHVRLVGTDGIDVTTFPDDPGLPGLAAALDGLDEARIVRYRPGQRCTLAGSADGVTRFVKVAADAGRIHDVATRIWQGHRSGAFGTAVAAPLALDPTADAVHLGVVPGRSIVDDVLGGDGPEWSRRIGRALGELSAAPIAAPVVLTAHDHLARTRRAVARAVDRVPDLGDELALVTQHLEDRHRSLAPRSPVPVHGAPHLHQWLADGDALGLVDFDRFALGDPEADIATYLAELDHERDLVVDAAAHERAVVDGFESTGRPLDPERLDLYRLHKRVAKVSRTTFALRPDGDHRAARHLAALVADLASRATAG